MTATFKFLKRDLQTEGADPSSVNDTLYVIDKENGTFVRLSPELWEDVTGRL